MADSLSVLIIRLVYFFFLRNSLNLYASCNNDFGLLGCWIIYKVLDNRMHELVAYELMSANDAPERDPMDWYDIYEQWMSITLWDMDMFTTSRFL